jgi:hypothetical protein
MKIGAKSSLEQVYKYALLHWLEQQHTHTHKQSVLLYIGKGDFQNLWSEKFIKPKDNSTVARMLYDHRTTKSENINVVNQKEFKNIVSELSLTLHSAYHKNIYGE